MVVNQDDDPIIGGMSCSLSIGGKVIDYEVWGMDGPGREYDGQDAEIKLEGVIDPSDTGAQAIVDAKANGTKLEDFTIVTGFGSLAATFVVDSLELSGGIGEMQKFSCTLKTDGGYTWTSAATPPGP